MTLDQYDLGILRTLQEDGRISNAELASRIALSPSACLRRVKILEESGLIRGYGAHLSAEHLHLSVDAFVSVTLSREGDAVRQQFLSTVREWPEVLACFIVTGDTNFLLRVVGADLKAYSNFVVHKLAGAPGVVDIRSSIVLETIKDRYALPLELVATAPPVTAIRLDRSVTEHRAGSVIRAKRRRPAVR